MISALELSAAPEEVLSGFERSGMALPPSEAHVLSADISPPVQAEHLKALMGGEVAYYATQLSTLLEAQIPQEIKVQDPRTQPEYEELPVWERLPLMREAYELQEALDAPARFVYQQNIPVDFAPSVIARFSPSDRRHLLMVAMWNKLGGLNHRFSELLESPYIHPSFKFQNPADSETWKGDLNNPPVWDRIIVMRDAIEYLNRYNIQNPTHEIPFVLDHVGSKLYSPSSLPPMVPSAFQPTAPGFPYDDIRRDILELQVEKVAGRLLGAIAVIKELRAALGNDEALRVIWACAEMGLVGERLWFARQNCSRSLTDFVYQLSRGEINFWLAGTSTVYLGKNGLRAFEVPVVNQLRTFEEWLRRPGEVPKLT